MQEKKTKKGFKLPHLMFLMLGMLMFMSIMTYIIPAGQFALTEAGAIDGTKFTLLDAQTPVNPWTALTLILTGLQNSSYVIATLLVSGGTISLILGTKAIDNVIDFVLYRLKDKGIKVLVPIVTFMFGILGAFGGGDHLVALVPIGVMIARKLKVDPIMAMGLTLVPVFIGGVWSPATLIIHWTMMDLPLYSGFLVRFCVMLVIVSIASFLITRYALRVKKDPTKSCMGNTDWVKDLDNIQEDTKVATLTFNDIAITCLFFLQFVVIVICLSVLKLDRGVQPAIMIVNAVICGLLAKWNTDKIGAEFAKGTAGMAFICFIIGLANAMSLVMTQGNILHTIVYYASLPLRSLSAGFAAVGISVVVSTINILIPSMSAKAAILFPIVKPLCETLGIAGQVGISAFQIGDQVTNALSPFMAIIIAGCATANIPYEKYLKFAVKIVVPVMLISLCILVVLGNMGWTGL